MTPPAFRAGQLEVDGVRLRYAEAGEGTPLVHLQGGGLRLTPAHALLSRHARVLAVELPERAPSAELAAAVVRALGLDTFDLMATSASAGAALALALAAPERVSALVLEAPTAILPEDRARDLERRLPSLTVPTLVVLGTTDGVAPAALGRVYTERIPSCHLVFVYDAGHTISADRPEAFAEVVLDFLERREAFVISRARTVIHP